MPNYDYQCICCDEKKEFFLALSQLDNLQKCDFCGGDMKRLITQGHGGTHGDEAEWIRSTNIGLTHKNPNHKWGRPITNRTEYKQRMKEKGVVHTD